MAKVIFLSHANADMLKATTVADELTAAGIDVRFDRKELRLGDTFLTFMESAFRCNRQLRHKILSTWR